MEIKPKCSREVSFFEESLFLSFLTRAYTLVLAFSIGTGLFCVDRSFGTVIIGWNIGAVVHSGRDVDAM